MKSSNLFRAICGVAAVIALSLVANTSFADSSSDCAAYKQQAAKLINSVLTKSTIEQFYAYERFLNTLVDDPEDCVIREIRTKITDIEENLIALEVQGQTYKPLHIYHCNEVDVHTQVCRGLDLDAALLVDEENLVAFETIRPLPDVGMVSVQLPIGFGAKILGIFAGNRSELLNGEPPTPIPFYTNKFPAQALQKWKNPALFVILQRDDFLGLRKCVWLFR